MKPILLGILIVLLSIPLMASPCDMKSKDAKIQAKSDCCNWKEGKKEAQFAQLRNKAECTQWKEENKDAAFARIKKLNGNWVQQSDKNASLNYRVTSGGSSIIETIFGGTDQEMVTVYHMDSNDLVMTHYCAVGNQPSMRAERTVEKDTLHFQCTNVSNTSSHDEGHMHALKLTFLDEDHLRQEWSFFKDGTMEKSAEFNFVRVSE
jgi:hypothetical protein